ncbi:hypothetical protein V1517DRAFT_346696 [Lipomyces orientalis]|uniref:Uncharacterized protein n=1 Tax=Lipomyces orientalis TaxID=1233043 RepID=A0ACC3TLF1_9ASCO
MSAILIQMWRAPKPTFLESSMPSLSGKAATLASASSWYLVRMLYRKGARVLAVGRSAMSFDAASIWFIHVFGVLSKMLILVVAPPPQILLFSSGM